MKVRGDTIRGLRARLDNPGRSVSVRTAQDEDGTQWWQLESEIEGKPESRQTFTVSNEALAAILEVRTILLRTPDEIARTLLARERSIVDFTPIKVEPTQWKHVDAVPGD